MLKTLALSVLAVFAPIKAVIITVGVLIAADWVLGIIAAYKRGEEIKSSGLQRTIVKMLVYQIAVLTGFLVETYLVPELGVPITKLIAGVIGVTEFKSIIENVESATGLDLLRIKKALGSENDRT